MLKVRNLIFIAFLLNSFIFAQENDDVEEVIITAQKKEERYVDVPVSVTTVSGEALEIARAGYVQEIVQASPSVTYNRTAGMRGDGIYIRGIGTSLFQSGVEPTISAVLDGVVLGRTYNFLTNLVDIERIEILRGPQGTLFGKNASGGVINIVTKDPSDVASTDLYVQLGSNNERNLTAAFNGPVSQNASGRLTIFNKYRDGFITNEYHKLDSSVEELMNGNDSQGFRGKLLWFLDNGTEVLLTADYENQYRTGIASTLRAVPAPGFIDGDPATTNATCGVVPSEEENFSTCMNHPAFNELEHSGVSLTVTRDLENHVFKSITSSRDSSIATEQDVDNHWDADWTVGLARNGGVSETQQFTQEFQLTNIEPLNGLNYTLGFFYFTQDLFRNFNRRVTWPAIGFDGTGYMNADVDSTNWALYADTTYELAEDLSLIAGLRYTNDELSYNFDRPTGPIIIPNIPNLSQ
ncbi:TonB-dependent receptor plug domain-containing protein [SAR86 cluster bacterium]|nr:TonB-dependent receptor plug domain-containing protein [SAR86 cluster bacterium]